MSKLEWSNKSIANYKVKPLTVPKLLKNNPYLLSSTPWNNLIQQNSKNY